MLVYIPPFDTCLGPILNKYGSFTCDWTAARAENGFGSIKIYFVSTCSENHDVPKSLTADDLENQSQRIPRPRHASALAPLLAYVLKSMRMQMQWIMPLRPRGSF